MDIYGTDVSGQLSVANNITHGILLLMVFYS